MNRGKRGINRILAIVLSLVLSIGTFYGDYALTRAEESILSQEEEAPVTVQEDAPAPAAENPDAAPAEATNDPETAEVIASTEAAEEVVADATAADETAVDETAADATVADETAVDETAADETAADETAADETAADETTADETAVDETAEETEAEETEAEDVSDNDIDDISGNDVSDNDIEEEIAKPAFNYSITLGGVTVSLSAPEGVLEEGTTASVTEVTAQVEATVEDQITGEVTEVIAYDINLYRADGSLYDNSWSEDGKVSVTFSGSEIYNKSKEADEVSVYHTDANGNIQSKETTVSVNGDAAVSAIGFAAEHFSTYTLVFKDNYYNISWNVSAVNEDYESIGTGAFVIAGQPNTTYVSLADVAPAISGFEFVRAEYFRNGKVHTITGLTLKTSLSNSYFDVADEATQYTLYYTGATSVRFVYRDLNSKESDWRRSPENATVMIRNYTAENKDYGPGFENMKWSDISGLNCTITAEKQVWDKKATAGYRYATWTNPYNGTHHAGSVRRFQTTFVIPEGFDAGDYYKLKSLAGNVVPINDDVFIFVYAKEDAAKINDSNYLNYLAFWTGTTNQNGAVKWHGVKGTLARNGGNNYPDIGWYCEAGTDNIGNIMSNLYGSKVQGGMEFIVDVFAVERSGDGGMAEFAIEATKNTNRSSVVVNYYAPDGSFIDATATKDLLKDKTFTIDLNKHQATGNTNGTIVSATQNGQEYKVTNNSIKVDGESKYVVNVQYGMEKFTVTWKNYDDKTLETDKDVTYGTKPSYDGTTPTRTDNTNNYTFIGWNTNKNATTGIAVADLSDVTANAVYYAIYKATPKTFTVTWKSEDGKSTLETDNDVVINSKPSYDGNVPKKANDDRYTYTFIGWAEKANATTGKTVDKLSPVTKSITYYAVFSKADRKFTVTWKDADGTVLETDPGVTYGKKPSFDKADPTKADGTYVKYTFEGWTSKKVTKATKEKELPTVTENVVYTASYKEETVRADYTIIVKEQTALVGPKYKDATKKKVVAAKIGDRISRSDALKKAGYTVPDNYHESTTTAEYFTILANNAQEYVITIDLDTKVITLDPTGGAIASTVNNQVIAEYYKGKDAIYSAVDKKITYAKTTKSFALPQATAKADFNYTFRGWKKTNDLLALFAGISKDVTIDPATTFEDCTYVAKWMTNEATNYYVVLPGYKYPKDFKQEVTLKTSQTGEAVKQDTSKFTASIASSVLSKDLVDTYKSLKETDDKNEVESWLNEATYNTNVITGEDGVKKLVVLGTDGYYYNANVADIDWYVVKYHLVTDKDKKTYKDWHVDGQVTWTQGDGATHVIKYASANTDLGTVSIEVANNTVKTGDDLTSVSLADVTITPSSANGVYTGYFTGWTVENGTTLYDTKEEAIARLGTMPNKDVTLYANFGTRQGISIQATLNGKTSLSWTYDGTEHVLTTGYIVLDKDNKPLEDVTLENLKFNTVMNASDVVVAEDESTITVKNFNPYTHIMYTPQSTTTINRISPSDITCPYYFVNMTQASVRIDRADLVLRSISAHKTYDGSPLRVEKYRTEDGKGHVVDTVDAEGNVVHFAGIDVTFNEESQQLSPNADAEVPTKNAFTISVTDDYVDMNYNIQPVFGNLIVYAPGQGSQEIVYPVNVTGQSLTATRTGALITADGYSVALGEYELPEVLIEEYFEDEEEEYENGTAASTEAEEEENGTTASTEAEEEEDDDDDWSSYAEPLAMLTLRAHAADGIDLNALDLADADALAVGDVTYYIFGLSSHGEGIEAGEYDTVPNVGGVTVVLETEDGRFDVTGGFEFEAINGKLTIVNPPAQVINNPPTQNRTTTAVLGENREVEIEDEEVPTVLGADRPQTGDNATPFVWVVLMATVAMIFGYVILRRKEEEDAE